MNADHKRLVEMAAGWKGSSAVVTVSRADAEILASVGAEVEPGRHESDPFTIAAPELCEAADALLLASVQAEVSPRKPEPVTDDGLEKKTVAELRALAAAESVAVSADAKKADVIEAIRKARAPK